jgi:Ca2+/Na+ antiporter
MKMGDRFWLLMNRKVPVRWSYYSTIFFEGFVTAVFLFLGIILLRSNLPWLGVVILLIALFLVINGLVYDNKHGYVDALYKRQVELWNEKQRKLGVK